MFEIELFTPTCPPIVCRLKNPKTARKATLDLTAPRTRLILLLTALSVSVLEPTHTDHLAPMAIQSVQYYS